MSDSNGPGGAVLPNQAVVTGPHHTEPTLHELADLAEELGDPLEHSLVLLEMIRDSEIHNERNVAHVAAGVMALIEQANQRRERLIEGPAQTTARLLEARIGELLPREVGGRGKVSVATDGLRMDRQTAADLRLMSEHRAVWEHKLPLPRRRVLRLIRDDQAGG